MAELVFAQNSAICALCQRSSERGFARAGQPCNENDHTKGS